jgi:hypothetical protein
MTITAELKQKIIDCMEQGNLAIFDLYLVALYDGQVFAYTNNNAEVEAVIMNPVDGKPTKYKFIPVVISRSKVKQDKELTTGSIEISMAPYKDFIPYILNGTIFGNRVYVYQTFMDVKNNAVIAVLLLCSGSITKASVSDDGIGFSLSIFDFLSQEIPRRLFSHRCQWVTYSKFCGLNLNDYKQVCNVVSIDGLTMKLDRGINYTLGLVKIIYDSKIPSFEIISVVRDERDASVLRLSSKPKFVGVNQLEFYPLCDKTYDNCFNKSRFSGFVNIKYPEAVFRVTFPGNE